MQKDRQIRVEDHRGYTKNPVRGTVVNTDQTSYSARKAKLRSQQDQQARLEKVENDVSEIKDMLKRLLDK